jgi:D-serine deaminase-like pyridoxal phosphate-dependent protein
LPVFPGGLGLIKTEGAGEVQTPLRLRRGVARPSIGDRVWWRHAKAGELMERFASVHLVRDGHLVDTVPTYRGEGRCFG